MRLLLIEDDPQTAAFVAEELRGNGHAVEIEHDGAAGLAAARSPRDAIPWDVVIVDRKLPGLDGLSVVRMLRARGIRTPILFLTALDGIDDRVAGLNAGADDYMIKPFALVELQARIEALARRCDSVAAPQTSVRLADLTIDLLSRTVRRGGDIIVLQPREYRLLEHLVRHQGEVLSRAMLLESIWDFHFDPTTNIVESHVSRLRDKLGRDRPELIHTVRGAGYVMRLERPG